MSDSDDSYPPVARVSIRDSYTIPVTQEQLIELLETLQDTRREVFPQLTCTISAVPSGTVSNDTPARRSFLDPKTGLYTTPASNGAQNSTSYLIQTIVGTVDPDNIYSGGAGIPTHVDQDMTTTAQAQALIEILDWMGISYTVGKAVQILNLESGPGVFHTVITALTKAGVQTLVCYDSAVPYLLPPVRCTGSILGFQTGGKGYVFHIRDSDTSKAYHALEKLAGDVKL